MSLGHGATIVRDGLVLYLDAANEKSYPGSGTTWYDLSGNGNDVTLINNPTYSTNNNGSFIFDGVDEYLSSVSLTHNGTLTAIFVAKYQSKSAYHNFFDRSAADPMLWIRPVDTLELNKSDGAVTTSTYTNEIHSFATISESAGVSTIYVEGAHVITDTQGS